MKVKELLPLLSKNQETELYYKDYGNYASYPDGLMTSGSIIESNILKIDTVYNYSCGISVLKIFTDKIHTNDIYNDGVVEVYNQIDNLITELRKYQLVNPKYLTEITEKAKEKGVSVSDYLEEIVRYHKKNTVTTSNDGTTNNNPVNNLLGSTYGGTGGMNK